MVQNVESALEAGAGMMYFYVKKGDVVYLALAGSEERAIANQFLRSLANAFLIQCGDAVSSAGPGELSGRFGPTMKKLMAESSDDKLARVSSRVDEVKGVMAQNIEMVMDRGEKLETLMEKSDQMTVSAQQFKKSSTQLKKQMWWKNCKMSLLLFTVIGLILFFVIAAICQCVF